MKKKFLTVISASCAVLALASCGGNGGNTGKHPKITLYGTESLTLMQNGKELASASDISASFGKDFELTFKPNNQFAFIKRLTPACYKKVLNEEAEKYGIKYYTWEEYKYNVEKPTDVGELAAPMIATPYVGYGNYIYPNDYALARDYAYTYDVNDDGSATLKVKGEYFQKNLIISFDRGITGDNDYCCPIQQLGLSDLLGEESWIPDNKGLVNAENIKMYTSTWECKSVQSGHSGEESPLEFETSEMLSLRDDQAVINDSLIRENATIKYTISDKIPSFFLGDVTWNVKGITGDNKEVTLDLKDNITSNGLGDYFINIPFINDGKDIAILEKCDVTKEHPYGYKLKYEKGIFIKPSVVATMGEKGIEVNMTDQNGHTHDSYGSHPVNVDFGYASFIGKEYKLSTFSVYNNYAVEGVEGAKGKGYIPKVNLTLSGGNPVVFDASSSDCTVTDWSVSEFDTSSGKDLVYHLYSVTNNKLNGWQLTIKFVESEKDTEISADNTYLFYFNPTSEDSLKKSDGKMHSSIKIDIEIA